MTIFEFREGRYTSEVWFGGGPSWGPTGEPFDILQMLWWEEGLWHLRMRIRFHAGTNDDNDDRKEVYDAELSGLPFANDRAREDEAVAHAKSVFDAGVRAMCCTTSESIPIRTEDPETAIALLSSRSDWFRNQGPLGYVPAHEA